MPKIFLNRENYDSFLQSIPDPRLMKVMDEISQELVESDQFPFLKDIILLGSYRSGNWAVRDMRQSPDGSDVDISIVIELPDSENVDGLMESLNDVILQKLESRGYQLCHLINPAHCFINILDLDSVFSDLKEKCEEFLHTEGSFEIEDVAALSASIMSPKYHDYIIYRLKEYYRNDQAGYELIRNAVNLFIEVMHTVRYKHLANKSDPHSKERMILLNRLAKRINKIKNTSGSRSIIGID